MKDSEFTDNRIKEKRQAQHRADLQHAQQKAQTNVELDSLRQHRDYCKEQEKTERERLKQQETLIDRLRRLTTNAPEEGGKYGN